MPNVEERYTAATDYVRRAILDVEARGIFYSISPVTGVVEWYAGREKTTPARGELGRIEDRWYFAKSHNERTRVARDAELLADRVQETLPGAPQQRQRTNLFSGESQSSTDRTSYYGEMANQAREDWNWIKETATTTTEGAFSVVKVALLGGSIYLGVKVFEFLHGRQRLLHSGHDVETALNGNLVRAAHETS